MNFNTQQTEVLRTRSTADLKDKWHDGISRADNLDFIYWPDKNYVCVFHKLEFTAYVR